MLPALGELRIYECDVAQLDAYFTTLQERGYAVNTRRTLRTIVGGTMQQAVLHKAAPSNPVRELERIENPRARVARAADLSDLIRFALGTGLRISEVCGVRICDLQPRWRARGVRR